MHHSARLVEEAKHSVQSSEQIITPDLGVAAKEVSNSVMRTISCLPGQQEVDNILTDIQEWTTIIQSGSFPTTNKSYSQLQQELNNAATHLNEASSDLVTSVRSPLQLATSSKVRIFTVFQAE